MNEYNEELNTFNEKIKRAMEAHFGEEYDVDVKEVNKTNGLVIHGLTILKKTEHVCPTIYLESYFERYSTGEPLGSIVSEIIGLFNESSSVSPEGLEFFTCYDEVKPRLHVKIINRRMNEKLLENVPNLQFLDLALVAVVKVDIAGCGTGTILVHNNHICMWGVSKERLMKDAMKQMRNSCKAKIVRMEDMIEEIYERIKTEDAGGIDDDYTKSGIGSVCGMYVISNEETMFGAAMIAFPEVLKEISDKLGGDYYILPSSVHEVIAISKDMVSEPVGLNNMIREVNSSTVKQDEILSDHAYLYLSENNVLVSVNGEYAKENFD